MITNFEEITADVSKNELDLIPNIITILNSNKGVPFKSHTIINMLKNNYGVNLQGSRLRKIVNYIRCQSLYPVIATSKGYFLSWDKTELEKQIKSLEERAFSILSCAKGLKKFL